MPRDFASILRSRLMAGQDSREGAGTSNEELKPGERRNIAVLFLDLGGFTALSEELDHEAVHEISKGVMDALVDVSGMYGGYVDKIEGDRIMVLFGAQKAGENDSERALSCALRMLDTISAANEILFDTGIPITARIGINSGPVTVAPDAIGHLTAMGRTVNLASRMEESARVGTILVPAHVHEKCSDMFRWNHVGALTPKGISRPVDAWSPTGTLSGTRHRWERISWLNWTSFVGRDMELKALRQVLTRSRDKETEKNIRGGARHIAVSISGEAGIGKSRLVHRFIRDNVRSDTDFRVLEARSLPFAQPAYSLWICLLRDLLDMKSDEDLSYSNFLQELEFENGDSELIRSAPFLAQLLGIESGDRRLSELDDKAVALETRLAFRNLLGSLAREKRMVLVLDDLQWIDETCRGVLEFILKNCITPDPVLFLLVHRPEGDDGEKIEFAIPEGYADHCAIAVESMDGASSLGIIQGILERLSPEGSGRTLSRVEEFLLEHSRGNPLFLEELILDLFESGLLHQEKGSWKFSSDIGDTYIPSSLTGLLQSRLDRLSKDLRGVLQKSSVLGFQFRFKLYCRLLEKLAITEDSRLMFDSLERRQLLVEKLEGAERAYMFRHALIRDTAYSSILSSNRRLLHRITAGLIEETVEEDDREASEVLVYHWGRADEREKAVKWGMICLSSHISTYQHDKAMVLSRRLEEWLTEEPLNDETAVSLLEVLISRNTTMDITGRRKEQMELLDRMQMIAREFSLTSWEGNIQAALGNVHRITGSLDLAEDFYRRALEIHRITEDREQECKVLCNLGMLSRIRRSLDRAKEFFEEAEGLNQEIEDPRIQGIIVGNMGNIYYDQKNMDKALEYYANALELSREVGDRRSEGIALGNLGNPYISRGEFSLALDYYRQALELHRQIGNRRSEGITLNNIASLYFDMEKYIEAMDSFQEALVIHQEVGNRRLLAITLADIALLHARDRNPSAAMERMKEAVALIEEYKLNRSDFSRFEELLEQLSECGLSDDDVPDPAHWK